MKKITKTTLKTFYQCDYCGFTSESLTEIKQHERPCFIVKRLIPILPAKLQKNNDLMPFLIQIVEAEYFKNEELEELLKQPYWYTTFGNDNWWYDIVTAKNKTELFNSMQQFCNDKVEIEDDNPDIGIVNVNGKIYRAVLKHTITFTLK